MSTASRHGVNLVALKRSAFFYNLVFLTVVVISVSNSFPGWMSPDSLWIYAQANSGDINDWHPPALTYIWSFLFPNELGPAIPFVVQNLIFWLGAWSIFRYLVVAVRGFALFFPLLLIQFQFTWNIAWIWKDAFELSMLTGAIGLFLHSSKDLSIGSRKKIRLIALSMIGLAAVVRWYLVPSFILIAIAITLFVEKDNQPLKFRFGKKSVSSTAMAGITVLGIALCGLALEAAVVRPSHTGASSGTLLLDLARFQCEDSGDTKNWIPAKYISQKKTDLCANYSRYAWDPLIHPTNSNQTSIILPEGAPDIELIQNWIGAIGERPGQFVLAKFEMLGKLLIATDEESPSMDKSGALMKMRYEIGADVGVYSQLNPSYLVARYPALVTNKTIPHIFSSSILPVLIFPCSSLIILALLKRRLDKFSLLLAVSPMVFAINMAFVAPAIGNRYLSPAAMLGVVAGFIIWTTLQIRATRANGRT